jgi:hypothetical protein
MLEYELSGPVTAWLTEQGFTVYTEQPPAVGGGPVDVVGLRGREIVAVELKLCLTHHLIIQAWNHQLWANRSWVCVASAPQPRGMDVCKKHGVGVLRVVEEEVIVVYEAAKGEKNWPHGIYVERALERLKQATPGGTGGRPNERGVGPAQDCQRRVDEYLKGHPGATWKQIYAEVENHYVSVQSMYGALKINRDRLWMRDQARKRKEAARGQGGRDAGAGPRPNVLQGRVLPSDGGQPGGTPPVRNPNRPPANMVPEPPPSAPLRPDQEQAGSGGESRGDVRPDGGSDQD